jgi:hypothetical protein
VVYGAGVVLLSLWAVLVLVLVLVSVVLLVLVMQLVDLLLATLALFVVAGMFYLRVVPSRQVVTIDQGQ